MKPSFVGPLRGAWLVTSKEIRETLRDRNLIVNLILVPLFLYPLLGFGAFQVMNVMQGVSERSKPRIVLAEAVPRELRDRLSKREDVDVQVNEAVARKLMVADDAATAREEWADLGLDIALVLGWDREGGEVARLVFNRSRDDSERARVAVEDELQEWRNATLAERARDTGLTGVSFEPWTVLEEDTSSASEKGREILSVVLPITLLLMLTMGVYYASLDTVVGERERGTLETLLTTSLTRGQILLGKFFYVVLASLVTLTLNLLSLTLFLSLLFHLIKDASTIQVSVQPGAFFLILLTAVLAASFFAAVLMMASVSAKNYREGQAALLPYYFGAIILGMAATSSREAITMREAWIPVLNVVALFRTALRGETPWGPIGVTLLVLASLAAAALFVASRIGEREDVTWGAKISMKDLLAGPKGVRR